MTQQLSPGSTITQVPNGPVVTPGIAVAIAGMLCYCASGPVGVPLICNSDTDGSQQFGGRITSPGNGRMTDNLIDFFNEGGQSTYVMRYIGDGNAVATSDLFTTGGATPGTISSSPGAFPVALASGTTFTLSVSGAGATTATVTANQAAITGTAGTFAAVTASHHLDLAIVGFPNQSVVFAGTENTEALFITAIDSQVDGLHAFNSGGQIELRVDIGGTSSAGQILATSSADVLTSLGLASGAHFTLTGGSNVANNTLIQATELATLFTSTFTGSTWTGNVTLESLTGQTTATGPSTSLQFTGGTGPLEIPGFDENLHSGSTTGAVETAILSAAMGTYPSPGSAANSRSRQVTQVNTTVTTVNAIAAGTYPSLTFASTARLLIGDQVSITKGGSTVRNTIQLINGNVVTFVSSWVVPSGGYAGTESVVQETWNLSVFHPNGNIIAPSPFIGMRQSPLAGKNYFVNVINSAARTPVNAVDELVTVPSGDSRPSTDSSPVLFTGGLDGAAPTATDVINVIPNWNSALDVNFISAPGINTDFTGSDGVSILQAEQTYVAVTRPSQDVMCIMSTPQGTAPTAVAAYIQNTANLASSYEAIYSPWILSLDAVSGNIIPFPPEPHILGIVARTYAQANIAAVPAGVPGSSSADGGQILSRPNGLEWYVDEQGPEYNEAYPAGANFILNLPGYGLCVYGSQTLDSTGLWKMFNVQAVLNIAKRVVKLYGRQFVFANINPTTNASLTRRLSAVFSQWRKSGILQGSSDAQAFYVICDNTNNTPTTIESNTRYCRVGLAIQQPAVFQSFTLEVAPNPANGGVQVSITQGTAGST